MGQILVSLCLPTAVYVAVIVLFVLLFRSGRTGMRHPDAVRVADWLHVPESIRAVTERTNTARFVLALVLITLAYACGITPAVQRALSAVTTVPVPIGEEFAKREVGTLLKSATPPNSSVLVGPYRWGVGNAPKVCYSDMRSAVLASSLSRPQIEDYYSKWLDGWSQWSKGQLVGWGKTGRFVDPMVTIDFAPEYLPASSDDALAWDKARADGLTPYLLTVSSGRCNGPFP